MYTTLLYRKREIGSHATIETTTTTTTTNSASMLLLELCMPLPDQSSK